jgi:peptidoglycan/xylan/chitin deacetylase (PgdA/CDA1 family)
MMLRPWYACFLPVLFLLVLADVTGAGDQKLPSGEAGLQGFFPNELGRVLILEYHLIQPEESRWGRSVENFKMDMERLYRGGYRPISISECIDGKITLPSGTRPVILTFDDSSPGQFRYLMKGNQREIDPHCAVGMLIEFHRKHADFPLKGIFFVLPEAKQPHKLFGQPEYETSKLKELLELGFELGNHTLWHANLSKYDSAIVQKQLALSQEAIQRMVPGYQFRALSLPLGVYPKETGLAVRGSYKDRAYRHEAILLVAGPPSLSPFDRKCDFLHMPRIQVPGPDFNNWLSRYERHPEEVFISDGDPDTVTFPRSLESRFNTEKFRNLRAHVF